MGSMPTDISASRGAAVLGTSKFATPVSTWLKIMEERQPGFCAANDYETPVRLESRVFEVGHAFEPAIIDLATEKRGGPIVDEEKSSHCTGAEFITCHQDGEYAATGELHEGKTTFQMIYNSEWGDPGTDQIPVEYQIQGQHQLMCTAFNRVIFSVLVLPVRQDSLPFVPIGAVAGAWARVYDEMGLFHQFILDRDDEKIQKMREAYTEFWCDCVQGERPPDCQRYDDVRKLFKAPVGTVIANSEFKKWSAEYKQIGVEQKQINARKDELKKLMVDNARKESLTNGANIDDASTKKIIVVDERGFKLHSYNGKMFR